MFRFFVLAVALVAAVNAQAAGPGNVWKGAVTLEKLQEVLTQANADVKVKSIDSVKTQVVAGLRYIVDYTTEEGKSCNAIWVNVPWKKPKIQNVQVSCQ
ncbi:hypothetical protein GE061_017051 [Apolygus lucorum]|uniref:Uncharacterized protein n=1 Tax=Apolygus lucorum TaxID=248454 RepID=A0A6A4JPV2_APOLU|nr:hypothetical protein GE061_017051 [Apolygus lucorum]